jgi:hypothetical protein
MTDYLNELVAAHASGGVVPDTHMLLLLVVGSFERPLVPRFKRTATYTTDDFDLLVAFLSRFQSILVTPHVLSEVNSLLGQLSEPARTACMKLTFRAFIGRASERSVKSRAAASLDPFPRLGLTDCTIIELSMDHLVLTDDLPLAGTLEKLGRDVINFNHLRF